MFINSSNFRKLVSFIGNVKIGQKAGKDYKVKDFTSQVLKQIRSLSSSFEFKVSKDESDKSIVKQLFWNIVKGEKEIPEPQWEEPCPIFEQPIEIVDDLMELLSDKKLSEVDKGQIREQFKMGVSYIKEKGPELRKKAQDENRPIYIRPGEYGGSKIGEETGLNASYKGSHIQVNPDGKIYLIPKHTALTLGKGTFKKVRIAIELNQNNDPQRVVAFASVKPSNKGDFVSATNEVTTIKKLVSMEKGENNPVDVRIEIYQSDELGKGAKAKMILPYSNMGDLAEKNFTEKEKPQVMKGCVKWIKLMHDNNLANFDIKRENFLGFRDTGNRIKVMGLDLDMARNLEEGGMARPPGGTSEYMAPEVIAAIVHNPTTKTKEELVLCDGCKADMFSLGKVLYFLDIGAMNRGLNYITRDPETNEIIYDIEKYKDAWNKFETFNSIQVLAKAMMHPNPELRPDIGTVDKLLDQIFDEEMSMEDIEFRLSESLQEVLVEKSTAPEVETESLSDTEKQLKVLLDNPHEGRSEELLKESGAWLIRKEGGKLYLDYGDASSNINSMELVDKSPTGVRELLDFLDIIVSKAVPN